MRLPFSLALLLSVALPAAAALQPRDLDGTPATVEAYYDTTLQITWLADWRLAEHRTWAEASAWAAALDVAGITGWRLPATTACTAWNCADTLGSELAHLWDVTLGNTPGNSSGVTVAPFTNMARTAYWTGRASGSEAYAYSTSNGLQFTTAQSSLYAAVAVRSGDVSPVPELPTAALLLAGGSWLAWRRRR